MFPSSSDPIHAAVNSNCFQGSSKSPASPHCSLGKLLHSKLAALQRCSALAKLHYVYKCFNCKDGISNWKEPYLEETGFFFLFYSYAKYKLFCKEIIVNQAGRDWIKIEKPYRHYNPREKCHNWSHQWSKCHSMFLSTTPTDGSEKLMVFLHDNTYIL